MWTFPAISLKTATHNQMEYKTVILCLFNKSSKSDYIKKKTCDLARARLLSLFVIMYRIYTKKYRLWHKWRILRKMTFIHLDKYWKKCKGKQKHLISREGKKMFFLNKHLKSERHILCRCRGHCRLSYNHLICRRCLSWRSVRKVKRSMEFPPSFGSDILCQAFRGGAARWLRSVNVAIVSVRRGNVVDTLWASLLVWPNHDFWDKVDDSACWLLWVVFGKQMANIFRLALRFPRYKPKYPAIKTNKNREIWQQGLRIN